MIDFEALSTPPASPSEITTREQWDAFEASQWARAHRDRGLPISAMSVDAAAAVRELERVPGRVAEIVRRIGQLVPAGAVRDLRAQEAVEEWR